MNPSIVTDFSESQVRDSELGFLLGLALIMLAILSIFYLVVPFLAKIASSSEELDRDQTQFINFYT